MNKAALVDAIVDGGRYGIETRTDAEKAIKAVLDGISRGLETDREVRLLGFGTLCVVERASRVGRNPQTGVEIQIPPSRTVRFRPAKALKEAL